MQYIDKVEQLPLLQGNIFGVDIECADHKICLIQISDGVDVYLLDPLAIDLKEYLKQFFESQAIKCFYSGQQDLLWLKDQYNIQVVNFCDIKVLAQKEEDKSLITLWAKYFNIDYPKEKKKELQKSNWAQRPLSDEQLHYAALDCQYLIELKIILSKQFTEDELKTLNFNVEEKIPRLQIYIQQELRIYNIIDDISLMLYRHLKQNGDLQIFDDQRMNEVCQAIIEKYKKKQVNNKQELKKQRYLQFQEKYTIHKQVYSNCRIFAPNGVQLCYCDEKKVQWYVKKGLADLIDEKSIRLKFMPAGVTAEDLDVNELKFYNTRRESMCVVCGSNDHYLKFQVVPYMYKHHFPVGYKSHRAHDVLVLCTRCHEKASAQQDKLRGDIAVQYDVPLMSYGPEKEHHKLLSYVVKKLESNLKHKIELDINQDYQTLKPVYNLPEEPNLIQLKELRDTIGKDLKNNHGELVVQKLKTDKDIEEFIKIFRKHFLQVMNPQFLPPDWAIDHKFKREFGQNSVFYQQ